MMLCNKAPASLSTRHFHCFLKSTPSGQPKVQVAKQGITSGFSLRSCHPDPKPCGLPQGLSTHGLLSEQTVTVVHSRPEENKHLKLAGQYQEYSKQ
ncbi:coagulation factor XI-like protein [Lates japonicus]|uniref:Coagulation factor XI-like protein n=1 Tax=Lates japonicus TaxID=270547 RepID=A0AAD3MMV2_LATJO|nr:coagulation factor XI-like protein [Lates japonicus]